jgi:hypothetical protein
MEYLINETYGQSGYRKSLFTTAYNIYLKDTMMAKFQRNKKLDINYEKGVYL